MVATLREYVVPHQLVETTEQLHSEPRAVLGRQVTHQRNLT